MILKTSFLLFLPIFMCIASFDKLQALSANRHSLKSEILYLPSGQGLEALSFGYKNALAHILWFNAISYFGKHYRSDKNYDWLEHYCKLTTNLAPKVKEYYRFCGTILSWEANRTEAALRIFSEAIAAYPEDWLFYYLRGFTYAFFADNQESARQDFIASARLPGANPVVVRLASKKIAASGNFEEAVEFLKDAILMSDDQSTKSILQNRLEELIRTKGMDKNKTSWRKRNTEDQQ